MANITPRRNGEFLRKIFEILWDEMEGMQARDVLASLGEQMDLTDFERGVYTSSPGAPRFHKIARFASISVVKAGWLTKTKGIWQLTDEGRQAYKQFTDPEAFYRRAHELYQEWRSARPVSEDAEEDLESEAERVRISYELAEEDSWVEIRDYLGSMNPYEFQDLIADLLRAMGYHVAWVAPPGKDLGVDILAYTDPLGTSTPRIKVQVKRRIDESMNVAELRSFLAVLGDDDVGIFVSAGGFTRDADEEARKQETRKITLIDLQKFYELWTAHYGDLSEDARRRFPLKPIYFLAPAE